MPITAFQAHEGDVVLGMRRSTFLTRTTVAVVAMSLVAASSQAVATAGTTGWHGLGWDLPALQQTNTVAGEIGTNRPVTAPPAPSAPAPKVSWPAASSYRVGLSQAAGARQNAGDISIARDVSAAPHSTGQFEIDTVAHDTATKANVEGSLIQVKPVSGDTTGPISVQLNYGGSAGAYGANYGRRLRFVQYPTCVLSTPDQKRCQQATALPSSNDTKAQKVSTDVTLPSAKDSVVVAAVAGASSDSGDFSASGLSPAGAWTSGGSGGDFTYSYPIGVPAALGGQAPSVGLAYSSGSVDGLTASTNDQPSWVGDGWGISPPAGSSSVATSPVVRISAETTDSVRPATPAGRPTTRRSPSGGSVARWSRTATRGTEERRRHPRRAVDPGDQR